MDTVQTYFDSSYDLSKLPYFELENGRLVLAEPLEMPVADVHTHLALSYLRRQTVDLWKLHPRTEHYLPLTNPVDIDVYANLNFTLSDRKRMGHDLTLGSATNGGMRATHTAANLIREMDEMGISRSLILPIDFPFLSHNAETYLELAETTDRLVSLASVHSHSHQVIDRLARQKSMGARGIKVHPAVQLVAPDNPKAMALYEACGAMDLPVLWHCGPVGIELPVSRKLSQVKHYWRPISELSKTTFVLGHSGALQFEMALTLAQKYENVYLETSGQSLTNVKKMVNDGPLERIMHGSDWPFYHPSLSLAKVLIATEGNESARRRILWDNAARLFGF